MIGDTPKRKQFDYPNYVNTTLRREITKNYLEDCSESIINLISSPKDSSQFSLNGSESNLPSKENSPKTFEEPKVT